MVFMTSVPLKKKKEKVDLTTAQSIAPVQTNPQSTPGGSDPFPKPNVPIPNAGGQTFKLGDHFVSQAEFNAELQRRKDINDTLNTFPQAQPVVRNNRVEQPVNTSIPNPDNQTLANQVGQPLNPLEPINTKPNLGEAAVNSAEDILTQGSAAALAGAIAGGAIGSAVPVAGTAAGATTGAIAGFTIGSLRAIIQNYKKESQEPLDDQITTFSDSTVKLKTIITAVKSGAIDPVEGVHLYQYQLAKIDRAEQTAQGMSSNAYLKWATSDKGRKLMVEIQDFNDKERPLYDSLMQDAILNPKPGAVNLDLTGVD